MMSASRAMAWRPEEDALLIKMFSEGKLFDEICGALCRSNSAVGRRVASLKLSRQHPRKINSFWTPERDESLRALSADNSRVRIARALGISEWAVRQRQVELNIKPRIASSPRTTQPKRKKVPELIIDQRAYDEETVRQDQSFQKAMRAAIAAGTERAPIPPTAMVISLPKRLTPAPMASGCSSPAAACAEISSGNI